MASLRVSWLTARVWGPAPRWLWEESGFHFLAGWGLPAGQPLWRVRTRSPSLHLAGSKAGGRMGRAERLGANMSARVLSDLWGGLDGDAELLQDLG